MMFFVYLLRSAKTGRFYTGHTANVAHRLGQHNEGITKSTRHERPWKLVHQEECATRAEAMRRERYWKTGTGREELRRLINGGNK